MQYRKILAAAALVGLMAITGCSSGALPENNEGNFNGQRLVQSATRRNNGLNGYTRDNGYTRVDNDNDDDRGFMRGWNRGITRNNDDNGSGNRGNDNNNGSGNRGNDNNNGSGNRGNDNNNGIGTRSNDNNNGFGSGGNEYNGIGPRSNTAGLNNGLNNNNNNRAGQAGRSTRGVGTTGHTFEYDRYDMNRYEPSRAVTRRSYDMTYNRRGLGSGGDSALNTNEMNSTVPAAAMDDDTDTATASRVAEFFAQRRNRRTTNPETPAETPAPTPTTTPTTDTENNDTDTEENVNNEENNTDNANTENDNQQVAPQSLQGNGPQRVMK